MSVREGKAPPLVTPELIAEASAWIAILHGSTRTRATEQGFARWMNRSDAHARAFEEATEIWEEARRLQRPPGLRELRKVAAPNVFLRISVLAAASLAAITLATLLYLQSSGITTGVGEQRLLALEDGSNVVLNTDSRVVVKYDRDSRTIVLEAGEALFEVAKQPNRPFYVIAGDRRIRAVGTAFAVRRYEDRVAVTLVEGKVTVASLTPAAGSGEHQVEPPAPIEMTAGERVVFGRAKVAKADRPQLDKVLAWQRREVALDDAALTDAIAEMNRYSRRPLIAQLPQPESIRVTGLFRAGDSMSFAKAVAAAYDLEVVEANGEIQLLDRTAAR